VSPSAPQLAGRRAAGARCAAALLSPWSRLVLLLGLLAAAGTTALLCEPEQVLTGQWVTRFSGGTAVVAFAAAYGVCAAALVPRPVLNLAAGVLFGASAGTISALAGTVLAAGLAFGLGRLLGQDALRPLLRGRWLLAGDRQLSQYGFRSVLALRVVPGVPFAVSNYVASVSRMRWLALLSGTALGSLPNTAAYVVVGSSAGTPASPVFLAAFGFIVLTGAVTVVVAWRKRGKLRAAAARP
jgi:uncharacterized membrane protein YdjX (TVP38/TMEM64 family)